MVLSEAKTILINAFQDDNLLEAILFFVAEQKKVHEGRLSYSGDKNFHDRAASLIEAAGAVMALNTLKARLLSLIEEAETTTAVEDGGA